MYVHVGAAVTKASPSWGVSLPRVSSVQQQQHDDKGIYCMCTRIILLVSYVRSRRKRGYKVPGKLDGNLNLVCLSPLNMITDDSTVKVVV